MNYEIVCTRGRMNGRRWILTPKGVKIGRDKSCEIRVDDVAAELFHCVVQLVDGKPEIASFSRRRGVDVNGAFVSEAKLELMDTIRVGGDRFIIMATGRKRTAVIGKVVGVTILLGLAVAGAHFCSRKPKADKILERPKPPAEIVSTNRIVRIVDELIVTTNMVVNIINNIVVTNYIEEVRRGGILVSSKTLQPIVEDKAPVSQVVPEDNPVAVDVHEDPEPEDVPLPEMPVKQEMLEYTAKDLEYAQGLPYKIIDPRLALAMGGAFGGDEVRAIRKSSTTYEFVHLFKEAARVKTLVIPRKNQIQSRSVRFLVVAGGGSAFPRNMTGGGGAGGVVALGGLSLSDGIIYAYVGAGGLTCGMGCNGEDSILTIGGKTYIAIGGGSGDGYSGGSGGGAGGGGGSFEFEGRGLQPESPTGGIGQDGTSTRLFGPKRRGGVCGGSPTFKSDISGTEEMYAKGGLYYERHGRSMPGDENTGSGADGKNGGRSGGIFGGSGIIIVRYAVRIPTGKKMPEMVEISYPKPDKCVMHEIVDGMEWSYYVEKGSVVIGCHTAGSMDFPDLWCPAVDTNAISGEVRIPDHIGGRPVRKIGKGAFQGCAKVTKFVVPEGVVECEARAFARCPNLLSVVYPKTLQFLGEGQFYRSSRITSVEFRSLPPRCVTGRCPLKGTLDPIHNNSYDLVITIPFEFSGKWRNWSQIESKRLIVCKDRCHRNPCEVVFSPEDFKLAKYTSAGFICEEIQWPSNDDLKHLQAWFVDKADDVWRKYESLSGKTCLTVPCLYTSGCGGGLGIPEHTGVIFVTSMFFKAKEPVYFMCSIDDNAMIVVDDNVIVGFSDKGCERRVGGPVAFAASGWHRLAVVAVNGEGMGGAWGMDGGVYYSRGDDKHWRVFEASPDGKTFRVKREDARRAVADIERAKKKKVRK